MATEAECAGERGHGAGLSAGAAAARRADPRARVPARLIVLVLTAFAAGTSAARVGVRVVPDPVLVGEVAQLQITSDEGTPVLAQPLPALPNVEWRSTAPSTSTSYQIMNGRRSMTATATYFFRAREAGTVTIPALQVQVQRQVLTTNPVACRAEQPRVSQPGGGSLSKEDVLYAKVQAWGSGALPQRAYLGQEVALDIRVYVLETLFARQIGWPAIEMNNAVFHDYSTENPENPKFLPIQTRREIVNGLRFAVVSFVCGVTPIAPGVLSGRGTVTCPILLREKQQRRSRDPLSLFDDSVFDQFLGGSRAVPQEVCFEIPAIPVAPLPPLPPGSGTYLGLVGQWDLAVSAEPKTVRVGDPVTLQLSIRGKGNIESLTAPKLEPDGFRVHDPEVKKSTSPDGSAATVTWALIPLEAGQRSVKLALQTFDPEQGQYRPWCVPLEVEVQPAQVPDATAVVADAGPTRPGAVEAQAQSKRAATDILYIKTRLGRGVRRPLWRNVATPAACLSLFGGLFYLCSWQVCLRREKLRGSESYRRRLQAARERSRIIRELKRGPADRHHAIIREKLAPCLAALLDLPPGTTATALADSIQPTDPELAEILRRADHGSFAPGGTKPVNLRDFLRRLDRLVVILALASLATVNGVGAADVQMLGPEVCIEQATDAYEQGHLEQAMVIYQQLACPGLEHPALLYNLGNCAYRLGELGKAVAFYERARRLAPRDSDIIENLNFVRSQLGLPPVLPARNPRELMVRLREALRPDEWVLLAVALGAIWGVVAGSCRWSRRSHTPAAVVFGGLLGLALLAAWSQAQSSYRTHSQGVVTSRLAAAYKLPSPDSEKTKFALHVGEPAAVVEERTNWLRVRVGDDEGWVKKGDVELIW